jgi:hypothetical protein
VAGVWWREGALIFFSIDLFKKNGSYSSLMGIPLVREIRAVYDSQGNQKYSGENFEQAERIAEFGGRETSQNFS